MHLCHVAPPRGPHLPTSGDYVQFRVPGTTKFPRTYLHTHTGMGLRLIRSNILSHAQYLGNLYNVIIEKGGGHTEGLPPVLRDEHGSSKQEG